MFKSEAKLFLSANNNVNSAKALINECKRLIADFDLAGNSDCKNLKSNINNCNINALVTKVENTKESLMKLDQEFASEYMTLLQEFLQISTIDTSGMTDEEKMQYSIQMNAYARDYNQNLLYILEKYEESGMLTEEMKQQLEYQRQLIAQYDIQDKMAILDPTTDEYINLFKQCADYDRKLINLNPSLSEEEKTSYLKEYNTQYNQNLDALINARDARLKREADQKELEELYAAKEENSNIWHPFVESELNEAILDKKIEMGIASKDEIEYKNADWFGRACMDANTFTVSTFTGLFDVIETIGDGGVMLAGGIGGLFGADTQWAEDYVSIDLSGELYQGIVLSTGMNSYSAYGDWHTVGNMVGNTIGYVGLSFLPGGAIVTGLAGGLSAMGSSSERALNSGATFYEAFGTGAISGAVGFASGWAVGKFNAFAGANTTSLAQVGRNILIGGGISTLEPIVNSVAEYAIYANDMVDENGNKVYDNIWDYYVDAGGLTNTVMAFGAGGISTGISSFKGYSTYKYEQRVDKARTKALEYYTSNRKPGGKLDWIDDDIFNEKVARVDDMARQLEADGILKRDKFYEIWGTPKGERPDPTTYLSKKYIKQHLAQFEVDGAARLTAKTDYIDHVAKNGNGSTVGIPANYKVGNANYSSSEFLSTKSTIDDIVERAKKSPDFENSIKKDLGLLEYDMPKYKKGIVRYDVSSENIYKYQPRLSSGNEPGAYFLDWIPGGKTLGGSLEIVVNKFDLNDVGNHLTRNIKAE